MRHGLVIGFAAMMMIPAIAWSQQPSGRAAVVAWRDSLAAITDTGQLRSMRTAAIARVESSGHASRQVLRLGYLELRLARLSRDGRMYSLASRALLGVAEDHPDWDLAWAAYALAHLGEERLTNPFGYALRESLGRDPAAEHVDEFVRSTGPAGDHPWALLQLADWAGRADDAAITRIALRAFRKAGAKPLRTEPAVAIARTRLEDWHGDIDSALAAVEAGARAFPDNPELLRLQAMVRFRVGRTDGPGPWYRGLALATGSALGHFRNDLAGVVPDSILNRLDSISGKERQAVLQRYWDSRDPDGLPTGPDRLAEHYRRLQTARRYYVRESIREQYHAENRGLMRDTLPASALDGRGAIFMKLGTPQSRTSIGGSHGPDVKQTLGIIGMPPNESWTYTGSDGAPEVVHFYIPAGRVDFVAAESILDLLAATSQFRRFRDSTERPLDSDSNVVTVKTYGAELVSGIAQELLRSRMASSDLYRQMLDQGKGGADSLQRTERELGREVLNSPPRFRLGFELPLHSVIDILAPGTDRIGSMVQVSFAIPGGDLTPRRLRVGVLYPVRLRVAARDAEGRVVAQFDTTRGYIAARPLTSNQFLLGQLPLHLPSGRYRVRAALESGRRGMLSAAVTVDVPDPAAAAPTVTDLSIGIRSVGVAWVTPTGDTVWTQPLGRFNRNESMQFYFEAGGIPVDSSYRVDLAVDRRDRKAQDCTAAGQMLTLSFESRSLGAINRVKREVSLKRLDPGSYVVAVTVVGPGGGEARRCRAFEVVK